RGKLQRRMLPNLSSLQRRYLLIDKPNHCQFPIETLGNDLEHLAPGYLGGVRFGEDERNGMLGREPPCRLFAMTDIAVTFQYQPAAGAVLNQFESALDLDAPPMLCHLLRFPAPLSAANQLSFELPTSVGKFRLQ